MIGLLALALALAEPEEAPPADDEAAEEDDDPVVFDGEEITVYAEERVRQARERVVERLDDLGYDHAEQVGDRQVFRHSDPWKGEVVLHDDGWTVVRRQPLRVEGRAMPWTKENTVVAWAGCLIYPWACIRVGGATVSKNKWRAVEGRTVDAMNGQVREWNDRIADLHTGQKIAALPQALEALWAEGQPLAVGLGEVEGGETLTTMAARREALFRYWDSRTETVWGEEVRRTVEGFCRAVVQSSEDPFTEAELERLNRERTALVPFDPERRRR